MPEKNGPIVVVAGSIGIDNVKTPFGEVKGVLGGSASFAALACSLFSRAGIVSVVGEDFPREHWDLFQSHGIDLGGVDVKKGQKTFRWSGEYGFDLNDAKTINTELNVITDFHPKLSPEYKNADFLFLGNIDPVLQLDILSQMEKRPKLVIADTMNLWINTNREKVLEVVTETDVCLMNEIEARQLFQTPNITKAAREILKRNTKMAIIKKGEHGCIAFTEKTHFACPGYPLENILDPTGSGDSFGGTIIGYLSQTQDFSEANWRKAIVYASSVASYNAEGFSVERLTKITKTDIETRYTAFKEFVQF